MAVGLGALLLALAGTFASKIEPGYKEVSGQHVGSEVLTAAVQRIRRPRYETAVGTVRAVHEVAIASKLLARVVEVSVKAGQRVRKDEVLVRLDDADLQARLKQAEAMLASSRASYERATADYQRAKQLLQSRSISQADYDQIAVMYQIAQADRDKAEQAVREAKVLLDYATIRAPIEGVVIDKRVEAGDTVTPGQVLLTLYDPTRMQMVVTVRESLAEHLKVGQKVRGRLEALQHECEATISEIVPEAQASSRSFTVKVTGPCPPGVYSGMFGRIYIPLQDEELVVVPAAAVLRVGQLELVDVVAADGTIRRRSVQLGRPVQPDYYEVLSGLQPGEKVVLQRSQGVSAQ
jgi:RND family efflux transporter MFP subunit